MANNADQISLLLQKPTDLDLHCLLRQNISLFSRTRVTCKYIPVNYPNLLAGKKALGIKRAKSVFLMLKGN